MSRDISKSLERGGAAVTNGVKGDHKPTSASHGMNEGQERGEGRGGRLKEEGMGTKVRYGRGRIREKRGRGEM